MMTRAWNLCYGCIKLTGLDRGKGLTNTCGHGLNELKGLLRSGIGRCCLAHKLDGLPGGKVVRVFGVLGLKVFDMRLQREEGIPLVVGQASCSASKKELDD